MVALIAFAVLLAVGAIIWKLARLTSPPETSPPQAAGGVLVGHEIETQRQLREPAPLHHAHGFRFNEADFETVEPTARPGPPPLPPVEHDVRRRERHKKAPIVEHKAPSRAKRKP